MSSDGQITKSARANSSQVAVDLQNQATRHLNGTSHETAALSFKIRAETLPGLAEDASLRCRGKDCNLACALFLERGVYRNRSGICMNHPSLNERNFL